MKMLGLARPVLETLACCGWLTNTCVRIWSHCVAAMCPSARAHGISRAALGCVSVNLCEPTCGRVCTNSMYKTLSSLRRRRRQQHGPHTHARTHRARGAYKTVVSFDETAAVGPRMCTPIVLRPDKRDNTHTHTVGVMCVFLLEIGAHSARTHARALCTYILRLASMSHTHARKSSGAGWVGCMAMTTTLKNKTFRGIY